MVRQQGQAVTAVVVVVTLTMLSLVAMARLAETAVMSTRAQLAADSVALAAVQGGVEAATSVARAHQVVIVALSDQGDDVVVDIELNGQRSTARARR